MFIPILIRCEDCNNPPIESTLDPPYGEIQEIYMKVKTIQLS